MRMSLAPIYNFLINFVNNSFSKIRSSNSERDGFICQSWVKMSKFIPLSLLRLRGTKKIQARSYIFYLIKKSYMTLLYLLIIVFFIIQSINSDRDGSILCQNVKIYLLILRLSGIEFR